MRYFIFVCALCLLLLPRWSAASRDVVVERRLVVPKADHAGYHQQGRGISQATGRIPLLIRLHPGNFQFDGVTNTATICASSAATARRR
jgi:biopolymer transport protein ExbB